MTTIGVERERFIVDVTTGQIVSSIGVLLPVVQYMAEQEGMFAEQFTYELYAGQVEDKTPPCCNLDEVARELECNDAILTSAADSLGLTYDHSEFVEAHQLDCLSVNPFNHRHQAIWEGLAPETRLAASAVAAVHVHIAVSEVMAMKVLNRCRTEVIEQLIALGDHTGGKRIASYRRMAGTHGVPPCFDSFSAIERYIKDKGGEKNVWDLVRYKPSTGTVEFRMFGATPSVTEILNYIQACLEVVG